MTTREKVLSLIKQELCVAEIAERVGVSKQRVYQILAHPVVSKGGRRPARLDHLDAGEPARKPPLTDEDLERARDILRQKPEWTWHSAYVAIKEQDMHPAANQVYDLLRELGFEYSRSGRNWRVRVNGSD